MSSPIHDMQILGKVYQFFFHVLRPFLVGDKVQSTKFEFFFLVIFGATLSRRFARQIFASFLSRKDLTKLEKQKNRFLFFVLFPTRYNRARQSQQKFQFCTLFLYSHKICTHLRILLKTEIREFFQNPGKNNFGQFGTPYPRPFARSGPPFLHKIFPPIRDFGGRAFSTNIARKPLETTGICQPSYGLQKLYHLFSKFETFFNV